MRGTILRVIRVIIFLVVLLVLVEVKKLAKLKEAGIINEEEFEARKHNLLDQL